MAVQLGELIEFLEEQDPNKIVKYGFGNHACHKGSYGDVAFEPEENVTFGYMLRQAKSALGATYTGYGSGGFTVDEYSECHIASYGESGAEISDLLLRYMSEC